MNRGETGTGLATPVLFMVFNRPHITRRVFEGIRAMRPRSLFVSADGPRSGKEGETKLCRQVREIVTNVDWDCELKTLLREENLGCKLAVSSAISWFFETVEKGIILEDDCLPDPSFFSFCSEMLEKYHDDKRIMEIVGTNLMFDDALRRDPDYSYYFSYYGWTWGWATWRRAWDFFDAQMRLYPEVKAKGYLRDLCLNKEDLNYRIKCFDSIFSGEMSNTVWDYQWQFAKLINQGLSIVPISNLVTNIGFGPEATHTKHSNSTLKYIVPSASLSFPLMHPSFVIRDTLSDKRFIKMYLSVKTMDLLRQGLKRIIKKIAKIFGLERILASFLGCLRER